MLKNLFKKRRFNKVLSAILSAIMMLSIAQTFLIGAEEITITREFLWEECPECGVEKLWVVTTIEGVAVRYSAKRDSGGDVLDPCENSLRWYDLTPPEPPEPEIIAVTFFDLYEETEEEPPTIPVRENGTIASSDIPVPTAREGFTFDGWFTSAEEDAVRVTGGRNGTVFEESTTVVARWSEIPEGPVTLPGQFVITLDANDGTPLDPTYVLTDTHGSVMTHLPIPTREGDWAFAGWFTARTTGNTRIVTGATGTKFTEDATVYARWTPVVRRTVADTPAAMRENFDWLRNVRHEQPLGTREAAERVLFNANGTIRNQNLIFDQIWHGNGTLNWAIRWESNQPVTLRQRQQVAAMLYEATNLWTRPLIGMEGWPFEEIPVTVVGWAVTDAALILDRQPNEVVWENNTHDAPHTHTRDSNDNLRLGFMASAPRAMSRFINHRTVNSGEYRYPGGIHNRFDMYLWCTSFGFGAAGHGGDWGTRMGSNAILTAAANGGAGSGVLLHEIGHGFGLYDFYGGVGVDRPPATSVPDSGGNRNFGSGQLTTIMHGAGRTTLNEYDAWQIRYYWDWVYNHPTGANRFRLPTVY